MTLSEFKTWFYKAAHAPESTSLVISQLDNSMVPQSTYSIDHMKKLDDGTFVMPVHRSFIDALRD